MASKERGLGKGLDALIPDDDFETASSGVETLPISKVQPYKKQPRKNFEPEALAELTESIRIHGIIQPLTVRLMSTGYYQIIAGERRWRAAKEAGLKEVPVHIIEADDKTVMEISLIENLQREDLDPVEEARGYKALQDDFSMTQETIAERMGKSRPAIANSLRLLLLPDSVLQLLESGNLSAGHARTLIPLESKEQQEEIANAIVRNGLSVRQAEALVKKLQGKEKTKSKASAKSEQDISIYIKELEKSLAGSLGRKVSIHHKNNKGKIELEYYNEDDLESLLDMLKRLPSRSEGTSVH